MAWINNKLLSAIDALRNDAGADVRRRDGTETDGPGTDPLHGLPRRGASSKSSGRARAKALPSELTKSPRTGLRVLSIGGGPRGESQAMAEMEVLRKHRADFDKIQSLGGKYDIQTVIVERRGEASIGRGNAWDEEHGTGTVNTGAEDGSRGGRQDLPARLKTFIAKNVDEFRREANGHPVLDTLLTRGLDGAEPVTDRAVMTRAQQGREANETFQQVRRETTENFPFYKLHLLTQTSAEKVDISSPLKPKVALVDAVTGKPMGKVKANTVRVNTGTTLRNPLKDDAVKAHAFVDAMDGKKLEAFFLKHDLLDGAGQVKPATTLALGGTGLSAHDQLLALVPFMDLFVRDDASPIGYRVSEAAKEKYQGAITFISNTPGKWIPPRHAHDPSWRQVEDPLGDAREQHALFLHHQGEEVFGAWGTLTDASVALSLGLTPKDVRQEGMETAALLQAQHANTVHAATQLSQARQLEGEEARDAMDASTRTTEGARRQAALCTILGLGLSRKPEEAKAAMSQLAPITYEGFVGYGMHRAQLKAITEPGTEVAADNAELFERVNAVMGDLTASPMLVHAAAAMLFEAGIARYQAGSYDSLASSTEGKALKFTASDGTPSSFDAFIVSPTFDRCGESALMSLSGQVKLADPRIKDIGEVTTHRRILSKDGQPTQVEDHSLNGKGASVPGSRSKTYVFSTDVNNRESAFDVAPGLAYRRMAQEHLAAAGFDDPLGEVERMYEKLVPSNEAHDQEAARFAPHFKTAMLKAEFLKASEHAAGDDAQDYGRLAKTAQTPSTVKTRAALFEQPFRDAVRRQVASHPQGSHATLSQHLAEHPDRPDDVARHRQASAHYADWLHHPPAFNPASNADYRKRFVDLPLKTHEAVYRQAVELAETRLKDHGPPRWNPPCSIA